MMEGCHIPEKKHLSYLEWKSLTLVVFYAIKLLIMGLLTSLYIYISFLFNSSMQYEVGEISLFKFLIL